MPHRLRSRYACGGIYEDVKEEEKGERLKMVPCLKQKTFCRIVRRDGRVYEATNMCNVDGLSECPRVTQGCKTGERYDLCGSTHAEANAARRARESSDIEGEAFLYGHTWICKDCQDALILVNVKTFHIMKPRLLHNESPKGQENK